MRAARHLLTLLPLGVVLGCGNDFTPPSAIQGLRVLAVRQGDGAVTPGSTVELSMLVADHRVIGHTADELPPLDVAWLGGCTNPPGRQYFACLPAIREVVRALADGSAPPPGYKAQRGPDTTFDATIPEDIVTAAPLVPHDPIHYGVSYVFFAACIGTLKFDLSITNGIPVGCTLDEKPVGTAGLVVGFTTLYAYDGEVNANPTLTALDFDGEEMPATLFDRPATSCTTADDCAPPEGTSYRHPRRCTPDTHTCAPVLGACAGGDDCPEIRVTPRIDTQSVERYTDGYEVMWASYYATSGAMKEDARLVVDRSAGLTGDPTTLWRIPGTKSTSRIWVSVNDQRGGATWGFFDVVVE
jgi:hypothetical protein